MASGIASTTRFIGILVGVAGLGAVLSTVSRAFFTSQATTIGLDPADAATAAGKITSGDLDAVLASVPEHLHASAHQLGLSAYAHGFASAATVSAAVAAVACVLAFIFVRRADTLPGEVAAVPPGDHRCKAVDCRHPL
jgi:hypothetical protein